MVDLKTKTAVGLSVQRLLRDALVTIPAGQFYKTETPQFEKGGDI